MKKIVITMLVLLSAAYAVGIGGGDPVMCAKLLFHTGDWNCQIVEKQ